MTPRRMAVVALVVVVSFAVTWAVLSQVRRARPSATTTATTTTTAATTAAGTPQPPAPPGKKITATLYYVAEDGLTLVPVQREIPFGEPVVEQARRIVEAQLGPAPAPYASAVPDGTALRALFISERGDAFVDISAEATAKHTGGALDELLTVYALVDALTVNLPAVTRVQILIGGKEVDTLAGHVDLRHPLQKNLKWVAGAEPPPSERTQ